MIGWINDLMKRCIMTLNKTKKKMIFKEKKYVIIGFIRMMNAGVNYKLQGKRFISLSKLKQNRNFAALKINNNEKNPDKKLPHRPNFPC